MKRGSFILIFVIGLMAYASCVFGGQITYISRDYSVWASAWESSAVYEDRGEEGIVLIADETWVGGYDLSTYDGTPVSRNTISPYSTVGAESSIGNMSLFNEGYAPTNGGSFFPLTETTFAIVYGEVDTNATGSWVFMVDENLKLSFESSFTSFRLTGDHFSILLRDLTDSIDLINDSGCGFEFEFLNGSEYFLTDSHEYYLKLSSWSKMYDMDEFDHRVIAHLQSVPEPSTLLLLGFGLIGLAGIRRKFNK